MTTQTLLTEWLENYEKEHVKSRTYARYHGLITAHINPAIGEHDIENLSRRDIQDFLSKQKSEGNIRTGGGKLSATSTNLILTVLNLAFEYACDMEIIEQNPCTRIRRSREDAKKVEAFTKDEQRKIENEIMNSDDPRLFGILLCLYTGVRIGELLGLEWADVDLQRGFIAINKTVYRDRNESGEWQLVIDKPKTTASDRIIPLPSYISQMMAERKENAKTNYVIENKKGERMSIRSYQYIFEHLTEKVGVRKLNFHALRHTFATRAIECGMDIKTLSEIMGHKNASITLNRYAHSMMDTKIEMMQKLPKNF